MSLRKMLTLFIFAQVHSVPRDAYHQPAGQSVRQSSVVTAQPGSGHMDDGQQYGRCQ